MKPLHIGLLVIGAALAGGLAVRMAEPPPLPQPSRVHAAPSAPVATQPVVVAPLPAVQRPPSVQSAATATAPPPIYSEPSHVTQPARRKPFGESPVAASPKPPVEFAKAIQPAVAPVPYRAPPEPVLSEPPHVTVPPRQVVLQPGVPVTVRLAETLSTEHAVTGETFQATLADPLVIDGLIVAERGARVTGRITDARRGGRMSGVSSLELHLLDVTTSDGQRVAVSSDPWLKRGDSMSRGSGILGALAGGPPPVTIASETVIRFRLAARVTITERRL